MCHSTHRPCQVFVSDNTNTDFCYNASLSATETINVRVIAINDAPTVRIPTLKQKT
jgi:hypothetical protein